MLLFSARCCWAMTPPRAITSAMPVRSKCLTVTPFHLTPVAAARGAANTLPRCSARDSSPLEKPHFLTESADSDALVLQILDRVAQFLRRALANRLTTRPRNAVSARHEIERTARQLFTP